MASSERQNLNFRKFSEKMTFSKKFKKVGFFEKKFRIFRKKGLFSQQPPSLSPATVRRWSESSLDARFCVIHDYPSFFWRTGRTDTFNPRAAIGAGAAAARDCFEDMVREHSIIDDAEFVALQSVSELWIKTMVCQRNAYLSS